MWEGWLEFAPASGKRAILVTEVESRQPEHAHLEYWATGLTHVYLEGALTRARTPLARPVRAGETPASSAPAPREHPIAYAVRRPEAVLDPFAVGARSLDILKQELRALNRPRLANIISAYDLNPGDEDVSWMSDAQLAHFIVVAVEAQLLRVR
jgi:hypothetical protein